jgi:hypothetical protein
MSEITASPEGDLVRLWWWNPGAGASCRAVELADLDEIRAELRAMGAVTWRTDYIPVTTADERPFAPHEAPSLRMPPLHTSTMAPMPPMNSETPFSEIFARLAKLALAAIAEMAEAKKKPPAA